MLMRTGIFGGAGADTLLGGDGDDFLSGGGRTDFLDGGKGSDFADYSGNTNNVRADLARGIVEFPGKNWQSEKLVSIEGVETGSGNDRLLGSREDNLLRGASGDDQLLGRGGDDILDEGFGTDVLKGGGGSDTADYSPIDTDVTVKLARDQAFTTQNDKASHKLLSIEKARGGAGDGQIKGFGGNDVINGGGGTDRLLMDFHADLHPDTIYTYSEWGDYGWDGSSIPGRTLTFA